MQSQDDLSKGEASFSRQNYAIKLLHVGMLAKLSEGDRCSISQLTGGSKLTRQAVTRHLRVLEAVGLVHSTPSGRENLFELDTRPFKDIGEYLDFVSDQWDQALGRLKSFVER